MSAEVSADEAIVLVGGLGTRLRPIVSDVPKPLAPVAGRPFLAWVLEHLAGAGVRRAILATGYMAGVVESAIGREWNGMAVDYSIEDAPLGTGGAVRKARAMLRGDGAHVLNGDTFLRYSPAALAAATLRNRAGIGIALAEVDDVSRYGAVERDGDTILRFSEKGRHGAGWINAGCYFLPPETLAVLPETDAFSLEAAVVAPLAAAGRAIGYDATGAFIDIGVPEDYRRAQSLFGGQA
jgi:D-glycero-alpha-D-manno-heptose 1-phosphate guanylyltransferase